MIKKIIGIAVYTLCAIACENSDDTSTTTNNIRKNETTLQKSAELWQTVKEENGNSYTYQVTFTSWTGAGHITTLQITEGIVTSRKYQESNTNETDGTTEITDIYTETAENIGRDTRGAKPVSIDQLYTSCAQEYLQVDPKENTIYLETAANGLLSLCGFVPNNCEDDCFSGIRINSLTWTN